MCVILLLRPSQTFKDPRKSRDRPSKTRTLRRSPTEWEVSLVEANDATNQSIREARNSSTLYTLAASCESPAFIALTPSLVLTSRENAVHTLGLIILLFIVFSFPPFFPPFFPPSLASSPFVSLFRKEESATEYATRNYRPPWRPRFPLANSVVSISTFKADRRSFYFFRFYGASWKIPSSSGWLWL